MKSTTRTHDGGSQGGGNPVGIGKRMPCLHHNDGREDAGEFQSLLRMEFPGGAWLCLGRSRADSRPVGAEYRFDHFITHTGLPQNTISAITQTRDGYLWFATYDGLVRYDGVRFTIFDKGSASGIPCSCFLTLWADDRGALWADSPSTWGTPRTWAEIAACPWHDAPTATTLPPR
jgi:hypothetical protein